MIRLLGVRGLDKRNCCVPVEWSRRSANRRPRERDLFLKPPSENSAEGIVGAHQRLMGVTAERRRRSCPIRRNASVYRRFRHACVRAALIPHANSCYCPLPSWNISCQTSSIQSYLPLRTPTWQRQAPQLQHSTDDRFNQKSQIFRENSRPSSLDIPKLCAGSMRQWLQDFSTCAKRFQLA